MEYCINCGQQLADGAKFCAECGTSTNNDNTKRKTVYDGEIHKCPNCGEVLNSFVSNCTACGFEFRGAKSADSIIEFTKKLEQTYGINEKISLILNFPVPNAKEDILEFMIMATTNISATNNTELFNTWIIKIEQCYQRAKLIIVNESDFEKIETLYKQANYQIGKGRKNQSKAKTTQSFKTVATYLPNILIVSGWIISLIFLIVLSFSNFNGSELLIVIDLIAGCFFIHKVADCQYIVPKLIVVIGLIITIIILIPSTTTNLDNVGTNSYQLLLIVDIIVSILICSKLFKKHKKQ